MSAIQSISIENERKASVSPQELFGRYGFTKNTAWNEIRIKMRALKKDNPDFEDENFGDWIWCQQDVTNIWNEQEKQYQAHLERLKANPNLMGDLEERHAQYMKDLLARIAKREDERMEAEKQKNQPRKNTGFYRQGAVVWSE
jgi:hypothetical protein